MIRQKNPFKLITPPVKSLVSGIPELVKLEGESYFDKNNFASGEPNDLDIFINRQANKIRDEFNQGIENKLVELVGIFGEDILKHIKIVMEPMMFSVAESLDDQYKLVVTVQGHLEYHEEEVSRGVE